MRQAELLSSIQTQTALLAKRFADRIVVNSALSRRLVSFQANKDRPIYRWFKYKEGFSAALVHYLLEKLGVQNGRLLDPFAGIGTTLFAASERGIDSVEIELLPVGCAVIEAQRLARSPETQHILAALAYWRTEHPWLTAQPSKPFPHLRITEGAFPQATQLALEKYLCALEAEPPPVQSLLRFAALCVLEEISYTRKDGQFLRWDERSGRRQGRKPLNKGLLPSFEAAIIQKLTQIMDDLQPSGKLLAGFEAPPLTGAIQVLSGSALDFLPTLESASFDGVITSPPYANRYDYTRTYALELALLGIDEASVRNLRQQMLSCTVENREKAGLDRRFAPEVYRRAWAAFKSQVELGSILEYLEMQRKARTLNNQGIPRMLRNYFLELALVIFDCARLLKPNAYFVMINDNVRYSGIAIPVDLILSDLAEQAGFYTEAIWTLPTGKGNSSQQMSLHGRHALRKSICVWRRCS
ncbi:MAG: DNA modification methylase [Candidatus Thermofonsia Clade 1 bacterium]|uniref:site-specific DNA-methyltransferase (cytosine-N(4)-specific) n=1 Tax=Candidatus Thermofonsia Clade 1 bacterium TaxID=2364210 RepID=A0A2M8P353_9CHLR|nr:MAG: DNA modification methylase [Candidatus Thermofonsia Clade 1 bacterium]